MTFSADAWRQGKPWYDAILDHPFIRELGDGTLPVETFVRYIIDDTHYLGRYGRALTALAQRWPEPGGARTLAGFAARTVEAEQLTHATMLASHGVDLRSRMAEPTPTCLAYASTLEAEARTDPPGVGLAALLPCFRVYAEVGPHLVRAAGEQARPAPHPFEPWLRMYTDPAFLEACAAAERLADDAGRRSPADVPAMHRAYQRSMRFEWMFWDAAWHGEQWPSATVEHDAVRTG